jgi:hypothetical protein
MILRKFHFIQATGYAGWLRQTNPRKAATILNSAALDLLRRGNPVQPGRVGTAHVFTAWDTGLVGRQAAHPTKLQNCNLLIHPLSSKPYQVLPTIDINLPLPAPP